MRPVDPLQFAKPAPAGGSARVTEAVSRVVRAKKGTAANGSASPRDPAPSRISYRLSRLWLTPSFRFTMRRVVPIAFVFALIGGWFAELENREMVRETYQTVKNEYQNRPEFMVKLMAIDGASEDLSVDIREVAHVDFPISSFDLDLNGMLAQIESLDAVADAVVRVRAGGILQIDITERLPSVVWRGPQGLEMLDSEGRRVAPLDSRLDRMDLPLIAGEGAEREVAEALRIIQSSRPILHRMRGLVRIGERRWNVVLDRGQTILLPEINPLPALAQVIALNQSQDLLERDVVSVDMRNPNRPTVRVSQTAREELSRIKALEFGVSLP